MQASVSIVGNVGNVRVFDKGVRTFFWTLTPLNRCSAGIPSGSYHPKTP